MPNIFIDPSGGISGDMFLAALSGLGFDPAPLEDIFRSAGLNIRLKYESVVRCGLAGRQLTIEYPDDQPMRHLSQVDGLLEHLEISSDIQNKASRAFARLAEVEASAHGIALDQVHFHEVGALDTVVDVVGVFYALEKLFVPDDGVVCAPLPWFKGTVECAHGCLPLPTPATAELMRNKPVCPGPADYELITPTGALLIDQLASRFDLGPRGVAGPSCFGFGSSGHPCGLRLFLFEPEAAKTHSQAGCPAVEHVWVLESHIDHLTGEDLGCFFEEIMEAGALDVFYQPGIMKKNRPAGAFRVICHPDKLQTVQDAFFRHSLTLGLRRSLVERVVLPRSEVTMNTPYGKLEVKECVMDGQRMIRPEYESLAVLARKIGRSVPEMRSLLGISLTD